MADRKVSTAVENQLRDYELVLIISPEVADEAVDAIIENLRGFVTRSGGTVSEVEQWGKKKLAYPLKHFTEGNYMLTRLSISPASTKGLEADLRISEHVLRHLLIRLSVD